MMSQNPKAKTGQSTASEGTSEQKREASHAEEMEEYGGGAIKSRHGWINLWLLVVYVILFVWAVYYAVEYWGGLGPGLDY
jgi:hypothetical protein